MNVSKKLIKLFTPQRSIAEYKHLDEWKSEAEHTLSGLQDLNPNFENVLADMKNYKQYNVPAAYEKVTGQAYPQPITRSIPNWAYAAAMLVITFGAYFLLSNHDSFTPQNYAVTQIENITLPDNSQVLLDKESTLQSKALRQVTLNGRAFFSVKSTADKAPFEITMQKGKVTVLGTKFSILSNDTYNEVSVEEGKVKYEFNGQSITLTAGQSATLKNDNIVSSNVNDHSFSWKNQILEFVDTPIDQAIDGISKYYKIKIVLEKNVVISNDCLLTTKIKNESVDQIMKELKSLFQINYYKKGTGFVITSFKC